MESGSSHHDEKPPSEITEDDRQMLMAFVETQKETLSLERERIELQRLESKQAHSYAAESLKAMASDRANERTSKETRHKRNCFLAGWAILGFLVLSAMFVFSGNSSSFIEVIKLLSACAIGVLGGYGYGSRYKKSSQDDS